MKKELCVKLVIYKDSLDSSSHVLHASRYAVLHSKQRKQPSASMCVSAV